MKKIARILSFVMIISMLSVPAYAETTTDEMIDYFADALIGMDDSLEAKYLELFELLVTLNDSQGMLDAYTTAMNSMAGGDQYKIIAMKKVLDNLLILDDQVLVDEFTYAKFKDYILNEKASELKDAFRSHKAAIEIAIAGMDKATIDAGFSRVDTMFNLQGVAASFNASYILVATDVNAKVYVYEKGITTIMSVSENLPLIDITDAAVLRAGIQQLADYYNASSQKVILYAYLSNNGLIKIDPTFVVNGTTTGTTPTTTTPTTPGTPGTTTPPTPEIDLGLDNRVPEGTALFGDIGRFTWAWTAIRQLYIAEVIKGKSATEFDPSGYITRAEFSALLTRMLETSIPTDTPTLEGIFDDVNSNKWYYKEVMAAFKAGFVNGVSISKFDPTANINREQIATILSRVMLNRGVTGVDASEIDTVLNGFADAKNVSTWAKAGSAMMADVGIITGVNKDGKKYFNFKDNASRAEVSVMLYRVAELIETKVIIEN